MEKIYSIKDEDSEFHSQIEITKNIWKFLVKLAYLLFDENFMIDDHYRGELKSNDYFSFKKDGIYLGIIMDEKRVNLIILGYSNNTEIKKLLFEFYSLKK